MDYAVSLTLAILLGGTVAFQTALIGAITRDRGGREASIISPLSSVVVVAGLLAWIAVNDGQTQLPRPFDSPVTLVALGFIFAVGLWFAIRGLPVWYATVGGFAAIGLVLVPRFVEDLGLALYFSAWILGQSAAALAFDHMGAFGSARRAASMPRIGGLALVGIGVVLVRVS